MTLRTALAVPLAGLFLVVAAQAQETATPPSPPQLAPYDAGLVRLSEILGATHYLRQLCGAGEGTLWRDQMQGLIDAEQADSTRVARLTDAFNRGYESFEAVYRSCTPAASLAVDRYVQEGARIARDIAARYGREE
ncbi:MAG: TIGR02301 family protein [Bauldia sp.]|nr:TIGR02301 family protein [Bauldia sp.]